MNGLQKWSILSVILLSLMACGSRTNEGPQGQLMGSQEISVNAYRVYDTKDLSVEVKYPARIKSVSRVTVVARISGILKEIYFKEGQYVLKDTLLFKIEPDIYQAEYESARAQFEQALAAFHRSERDWERIKGAYDEGLVSEKEKDAGLSAYEEAKAFLESAKARLRLAELNLTYTDVKAPVDGLTGTRLVDPGNLVNPGTPLVNITEINPIFVEFSIPDTDMKGLGGLLHKGLQAELLVGERPYRYKGKIDFIDSVIDEKTASVSARAVFPNPEKELLPGEFVRVVLKVIKKGNMILIPQRAVMQTPGGSIVYVVENHRAVLKNIKIGESVGDNFIVNEGLSKDELVILDNLMKIRPGSHVKIEKIVNEEKR